MIATTSHFRAQAGKEDAVRKALRDLAAAAEDLDPPSRFYTIHESLDEPGVFMVYDEQDDADEGTQEDEELLKLGTALREALVAPIEVARFRILTALESGCAPGNRPSARRPSTKPQRRGSRSAGPLSPVR